MLLVANDPILHEPPQSNRCSGGAACAARVYALREYVDAGGLVSYGPSLTGYRIAWPASTQAEMLKGTKPADLPVQQPTKFDFAVNLKTAKALGLDRAANAARPRRRGDRMSNRREFISLFGGAAAWPVVVRAQQPAMTIGFLGASTLSARSCWSAAFVQRLRELGWVEGATSRLSIVGRRDAENATRKSRPSSSASRWMSSLRWERRGRRRKAGDIGHPDRLRDRDRPR